MWRNEEFVMLLTVAIGLMRGEVDLTLIVDHSMLKNSLLEAWAL